MRTAEEMIAYALEIDPVLLPYVPELLEDLEQLGTDPQLIVEVMDGLSIPAGSSVLDLGCGKGAVSIEIAKTLGLPVFGIDLYQPFIEHCERTAAKTGVAHLCTFRHGDILSAAQQYPTRIPADVAVFAALGDVLGSFEDTVGILRQYVREGGFLLIYDDYVKAGGSANFPRFENYCSREETIRNLESHGDVLLRIVEESDVVVSEKYDRDNAFIRRRAEALADRHPSLREAFLQFAANQEGETAFLEEHMVSAVWVLQRRRVQPDRKKQM